MTPISFAVLLVSWLMAPALPADEVVEGQSTITAADDIETWDSNQPQSFLRAAQSRISPMLCDFGMPGEWADKLLDRYLTALEAGPNAQSIIPPPAAPEWCDGLSTGPPPAPSDRFMVRLSFRF